MSLFRRFKPRRYGMDTPYGSIAMKRQPNSMWHRGGVHRGLGLFLWTLAVTLPYSLASAQDASAEDPWGGIRLFAAELSAANQPTVTKSAGTGVANIKFDIPTMTITWDIRYGGLTSPPTAIHLHGPAQPGTNAVAIVDLGSNGLQSPISGSVKITDAQAQYMLLGWTYVLLKTRNYPGGELRGKLDTVPPPGFKRNAGR